MHKGDENEWSITVHGIWSEKEKVDLAMRRMNLGGHIKHISFANSTRNERIGGLQLNKCINTKLKCECLENFDALDKVTIEGKNTL